MTPYYEDQSVTIYHGEALAVLADLDTASADVLLTDPPYSSGGMFRTDRAADPTAKYRGWSQNADGSSRKPTAQYGTFGGDCRDQWSWIRWCAAWGAETLRVIRPSGVAFQFTDWRQLPATTDAMQFAGWTWQGVLVWDKGVARPMAGRFRNHIEYIVWASNGSHQGAEGVYPSALIAVPTVGVGEREHVTQKPVALLARLLSVIPGERLAVLDPFMGVGSTLLAAKNANCEIAARRLDQGVLLIEEGA